MLAVPIQVVNGINFYHNEPHEIHVFSFKFDTIRCIIDSISRQQVFFRQENNFKNVLEKHEIFAIFFDKKEFSPELNRYKNHFIQIQKNFIAPHDINIVLNNGKVLVINKLNSIDSSFIYFTYNSSGVDIATYTSLGEVDRIILNEPFITVRRKKNDGYFILFQDDEWIPVNAIENIKNESIGLQIIRSNRIISHQQNKNSIEGLFFFDFESYANNDMNFDDPASRHKKIVNFSINSGIGYLVSKADDRLGDIGKNYIDELRLGLAYDITFSVFPIEGFGIGIKFNQYKTSNSILDILEDNIKITFFGGTITGQKAFLNHQAFFNTSFSVGRILYDNQAVFFNEKYPIKGSSLGLSLTMGVDFLLTSHLGIGIHGGLIRGVIKNLSNSGIDLDDKFDVTRLECMVGLKFYL